MCVPKVTSITYVKNNEDYIERCVRSVMNQTLKDIEIIVVDGGSTDRTWQILEGLANEDKRIKLLSAEGSVGAQFNLALSVAGGEYIGICEGDDFILPEKYEKQYEIAHNNNLDVLRANFYMYFDGYDGEHMYKIDDNIPNTMYDRLVISEDNTFLAGCVNAYWSGLYSREFLEKYHIRQNETRGAAFQDTTISFLTQLYAKRIWFMSERLHCYRIDNPAASVYSSNFTDMLRQEFSLLADTLKKRGLWESYRAMFICWYISSSIFLHQENSVEDNRACYAKLYDDLIAYGADFDEEDTGVPPKIEELRKKLYRGREDFVEAMHCHCDSTRDSLSFFDGEEFENTKELIVFGAGNIGRAVYDFLILCNKRVLVVDNDRRKWQEGFNDGVPVYDPRRCLEGNARIIIANALASKEIARQLIAMGVDSERLVECYMFRSFLRDVYVKRMKLKR